MAIRVRAGTKTLAIVIFGGTYPWREQSLPSFSQPTHRKTAHHGDDVCSGVVVMGFPYYSYVQTLRVREFFVPAGTLRAVKIGKSRA